MLRLTVSASGLDVTSIQKVAAVLRGGGVVAAPTDTLYGLAADPFSSSAVKRVFALKGRAAEEALPLVASSVDQIQACLGRLPVIGVTLAERFWPGPLTLVMRPSATLAPEVTGDRGTVGVRVPDHAITRALCEACGFPLTATSANISGQPATRDPDVVWSTLGTLVDVLLDAGLTPGGPASTIVDVTGVEPKLIRAGAIPWDAVLAASTQQ